MLNEEEMLMHPWNQRAQTDFLAVSLATTCRQPIGIDYRLRRFPNTTLWFNWVETDFKF